MAKHCTVCNQDYADDLEACPHCTAADTMHRSSRGEERATQMLNRGDPRATQLAEHGGKPAGAEPAPKTVAPDIVDLLGPQPEPIEMPSDSQVDLGSTPSESQVDLGGPPMGEIDDGSGSVVQEVHDSGSEVFVAELAEDVDDLEPVSDSGSDLHKQSLASAGEGGSSAIDLSAAPEESGEASSEVAALEEVEDPSGSASGIELEAPLPRGSRSENHPSSDSDVDLDKQPDTLAASARATSPEEPAVSEKEVDDLLAGLEEEPGSSETVGEAAEIAEGEEALAAAEAEEAAAAEETKAEKPAKAAKQPSRLPALVGGTLLGILLGAGGTIGTQAVMGPGEKPKASIPGPVQTPVQTAANVAAPVTFETLQGMVSNGDWEGANKAGIDTAANKPEELAVRGQYRLGQYLQKHGLKLNNEQDASLQAAIQDLQQAGDKNPDAVYDLAFIKELSGKLPEARDAYAKGAQTFANDPVQKQRFEAGLSRVEWKASVKPPKGAGAALPPLPTNAKDRAKLLAFLLIALQQPQQPQPNPQPQTPAPQPKPPQPNPQPQTPAPQPNQQPAQPGQQPGQQPAPQGQQPAPADNKEAGYEFWQAAKLAHQGKYSEAIQTLDKARATHDQRRFSRLRKAQNPFSDPAEDIFLRCCDELKVYWQLENRLREGGYLTDKNTPEEALQALVQKAGSGGGAVKNLTEQLVAAKIIGKDEDVSKGITRLANEKKAADAKVADLQKMLQTAKDESAKLDEKLKTAEKASKDHDADVAKAKEQNAKLKTDYDNINSTLTTIRKDLTDAKLLAPQGNVNDAVKKAVDIAKSKDTQGTMRQQREEISRLSAALKQTWRPEDVLPMWSLILDENRNRADLADKAAKDAERVRTDPRATLVQKHQAEVVLGQALRNADQFAKAKSVLEAARGSVDQGEWLSRTNAALREVSNPAVYLTSEARLWYDHGQMDKALALLKRAEKVLPAKEHSKLWAQRSLIELDAARAKARGALPAGPLLDAARKDAEAAAKAGSAAGHYAAGRIAEEIGQVDEAVKSYRAALTAHGNRMDAEGSRYRMALARVLLLPREAAAAPPAAPAKPPQKLGRRDPMRRFEDIKGIVWLMMFGLQVPLLPGDEPGVDEAEKLADEVLKAPPGSVPFNVLAQALAVKGRWDAALQVYVDGIRPMLPREYGDGLAYLVRNDPRLKRPGGLRTPNPLEAERHFASGLTFYFDRDYGNAEKEFLLTIENDSQDARFFYFLGLSRLAQNRRRDAAADFDQAVLLERLNRPGQPAVDESLERVQGPDRRTVNEARQRPER